MSTPQNPSHTPTSRPVLTSKGRVLVVDDVSENREILAYYLGKAGYDVVTTQDGLMAIEGLVGGAILRRSGDKPPKFDLVLMDMQMPRMDGYEAVRTLRSQGFRTPVVAVTAHTLTGDREKCLAAGCDEYIGKPVDPEKLVAICDELVAKVRSRAAA